MGVRDGALVAPFVGERYADKVSLTDVVAPPYDVIDEAGRAALARRHRGNVVHVILPQGNGDRYGHAARLLADWRGQGLLAPDPGPGVYVVRQQFALPGGEKLTRSGVIAAVAAEPFAGGRVKPHERTHAGPKQDRLALLRATQTMCEALLLLSRDSSGAVGNALAEIAVSAPLARAELDGVHISLWRVAGEAGAALAAAAGKEPLYVADGHHRYETTVAYGKENPRATRTLGLIVPLKDPGLVVLPTHRLLATRGGDDVIGGLKDAADVEALPSGADTRRALAELQAAGGGCVVVLPTGRYRVVRRPGSEPSALREMAAVVRSLDVAWADAVVVLGLARSGGTDGLRYTPDLDQAMRAVREREAGAAVLLNPPAVEQVLAVADAGAFMPPKATFFAPKVPSGLVFLHYGEGS